MPRQRPICRWLRFCSCPNRKPRSPRRGFQRPRAESTERTESFQPHLLGGRANAEHQCYGNSPVQSRSGTILSVHSVHSAVPLDAQSGTCCASRTALSEAQPSRCARQPEGSPDQGATAHGVTLLPSYLEREHSTRRDRLSLLKDF